jgi:hypothetical protein
MRLDRDSLEEMVRTYFAGVDGEDLPLVFSTLASNCVFTVETHKVKLVGRSEITRMFDRLWAGHKAVCHDQFEFVTDLQNGRVSVQFRVTNTLPDDSLVHKSNCNFFTVTDGMFSAVNVYMSGANTLHGPTAA